MKRSFFCQIFKSIFLRILKIEKSGLKIFTNSGDDIYVKGGPTNFWFSHFLTLNLRCTFIFHPKYPYEGLKWPGVRFLSISKNEIFPPFFVLGESPTPRKFFSRKIVYAKSIFSFISPYFLTGPGLKER